MNTMLIIVFVFLLVFIMFLLVKQYSYHKRVLEMTEVITGILDGQKKRQIFTNKKDALGMLAFSINRLAGEYGTAQTKYEKEQIAKKQLISNLSHDIRTPLVSVIGYLEAIVQNRISEEQKDDYINTAYEKSNILKVQMNQLFEFVQSDANEIVLSMEKTDVCEIVRQVLIDFLPVLEQENIVLDASVPDEELWIFVDRDSLVRIVQNILRNTLVHGSEGKYLGVFVKKELGSIYIDIADRGQGIDKEHLPFVFERLYKADMARARGGGIGLAIAKELSNQMDGNVEILRSIPGDTVFRVTFPTYE